MLLFENLLLLLLEILNVELLIVLLVGSLDKVVELIDVWNELADLIFVK